MQLLDQDIERFLGLIAPDEAAEVRAHHAERLRAGVQDGSFDLANMRVARAPTGELTAALRLQTLGETSAVLTRPAGKVDDAALLVDEAIARAAQCGLTAVGTRPLVEQATPRYREALLDAGFVELGERIEFKSPIEELPDEEGSPLRWKDMGAVGRDLAVDMLARTSKGDPHSVEEHERPAEALDDMLSDVELSSGPQCVQIGYLDEEPVAFVMAQVGEQGWSRISYMGIVPDARGRGLGTWVHRRGFAMMRAQGGTLYHGGTAATNGAMLHLFEVHGCKLHERMVSFEWTNPQR